MSLRRLKAWAGHDDLLWPVVLPLLLVVFVPTIGVLSFMIRAIENEQLAVRQRLVDIYRSQLVGLQGDVDAYWQGLSSGLDPSPSAAPAEVFAEKIRAGLAEAVVIFDSDGRLAYPSPSSTSEGEVDQEPASTDWRRALNGAQRLERAGRFGEAADAYASLAAQAEDRHRAAQALQAQARCLVRAQRVDEAISVLTEELGRLEFRDAADAQGRLIQPSARLRALQLIEDRSSPLFQQVEAELSLRLRDYGEPQLSSSQRRFLIKELLALAPNLVFDTLDAEELAASYLNTEPVDPPTSSLQPGSLQSGLLQSGLLQSSGLPGYWLLKSADGRVVALFEQLEIVEQLENHLHGLGRIQGATIELLPPKVEADGPFRVSLPAGASLPDWQLVLRPEDETLFATAADQRIRSHMLTGFLLFLMLSVLGLVVGRAVSRQVKLTRLKNDLLSTVSHELKTPLASMRLLVDTLLETGTDDSRRVREYLELIAQENTRLSRLVENFLTFSKMEQGRQSFDQVPLSVEALVQDASASVADRFETLGCRFEVEISPDLPEIVGDHDALVTVLINLLDNAEKYSEEEKDVQLRAFAEGDAVCLAVTDRGIGLSPRAQSKIFDRFYQVDQSLARAGSGCGLGLSIVRSIVEAHDGKIDVESRLGEGSTFTVRLPISSSQADKGV